MKKSNFLIILLLIFACKEREIELTTIPAKTIDGYVNVLVTTQKSDSLISTYNFTDKKLNLSKDKNYLQDIAHLGLIAGNNKIKKVIVLEDKFGNTRLQKVKPLGVISIELQNKREEWFIFASQTSLVENFDDFMLNHFSSKERIQDALLRRFENQKVKTIWYGENFLNSKLNKALSL